MTTKINLNIESNLGYAADQVQGMPIGELIEALQQIADEYGDDTELVVHQVNTYGANFGSLYRYDVVGVTDSDD